MKLNVGCGYNILEGYINIDMVQTTPETVQKDILHIDYADESVDEIFMRHSIEHFFEDEIRQIMQNNYRMLRSGGIFVIETPDFERIMEAWQQGLLSKQILNWVLFGFQAGNTTREREIHMLHKWVFDEALLCDFLREAGFSWFMVEKGAKPSNYDPKYGEYMTHMKVTAVK
jgi:predicted SAM-dependent methyltransferase